MNTTTQQTFEAAKQAVKNGEMKNLSERTMNKLWNQYFAAEDAMKAVQSWK